MGKYKQLTENQRSQIYALKKVLNSQQAIADVIGVNQAAISRGAPSMNNNYRV